MRRAPARSDLDDLPDELVLAPGPLRIRARDPETGETHETLISREHVAAGVR